MKVFFRETAAATLHSLKLLREDLSTLMSKQGVNEGLKGDLLLAYSEYTTNLIEHSRPRPRNITVSLALEVAPQLSLSIEDDGGLIPDFDALLNAKSEIGSFESLEFGGMGLHLIGRLFPRNQYVPRTENQAGGNRFTLLAPLETPEHQRLSGGNLQEDDKPLIYVVEDDPFQQAVLAKVLQQDYHVSAFTNPLKALEMIEQDGPPALILSDISMPEMDGLELRKRIHSDERFRMCPFIFLTGNQDQAIASDAVNLGVDDYITKPIDADKLLNSAARAIVRGAQLQRDIGAQLDAQVTEVLKPELPQQVNGWDIHLFSQEAEAGGGDLALHLKTKDGALIVLADIMGHGVQAKFFVHAYAGYLYGLLRALSAEKDLAAKPHLLLEGFNNAMAEDEFLQRSMLTLVVLGITDDGKVSCAVAGHSAPLIVRENTVEELQVSGPLLGLLPGQSFLLKAIPEDTQRLILYTDGLLENGLEDGMTMAQAEKQLTDAVLQTAELPPAKACQRLITAMKAGEDAADDLTLITLSKSKKPNP